MNTTQTHIFFFLAIITLFVSSCSTTRDNFFSRTYHQTTTKYNGYFNANESIKRGLQKIKDSHKDNYQQIISLDKINRVDLPGQVFPNMDRAIEKTTKMITRHSMEINNKEKNKWIDDNYYLMAKARFYKKEYLASQNTFKFLIRSFPKSTLFNNSVIWSAKCDLRLGNIQAAKKTLNSYINEKKLTKKETVDFYLVLTEISINEKNYQKAIKSVKKAISQSKKNKDRARYYFVLAQLNEKLKQGDKAILNYNNVIKSNPEYEMSFRAALNKANSYTYSSGKSNVLLKEYRKMLKDAKNKDYRDQIYYAIGEINLNDGDTTSAVLNFQRSINNFLFDINQKLQTHQKLANIYFEKKLYKKTYNQKDSILMLIDVTHENYANIKKTHKNLKEVVDNKSIIHDQDSLLSLGLMTKEERNKKIDDYIASLKQKDMEERAQKDEERNSGNFNLYEYNKNQNNLPVGGGWYFYNPTAMSFGFSEFLTRWGNRKNEDNWRRKNKTQMNADELVEEQGDDGPSVKERYSRDYYLSKIPITKSQQDSTLKKIENAYYNLGAHLKNNFDDYLSSIDVFEEMLTRFLDTEYKLLVYIQLISLYDIINELGAKKDVLSFLQKEFPDNKYINTQTGEVINNENINQKNDYDLIYELYKKENYNDALDLINRTKQIKTQDKLNVEMIEAFCISKIYGKKKFIEALELIVKNNPNTTHAKKSSEMLDVLYGSFYESKEDLYKMEPKSKHHMIITVSSLQVDIPEIQNIITKFNNKNYNSSSLKITNLLLNKDTQIIKISDFNDGNEALNYYESTLKDAGYNSIYDQAGIDKMIISKSNFLSLLNQKNTKDYKIYFNEKYLN